MSNRPWQNAMENEKIHRNEFLVKSLWCHQRLKLKVWTLAGAEVTRVFSVSQIVKDGIRIVHQYQPVVLTS